MVNMKSNYIFMGPRASGTRKLIDVSVFLLIALVASFTVAFPNPSALEDPVVTKLRTYLRIKSAHPDPRPGYEEAVEWLKQQASEIGLDFHYLDLPDPQDFALWMTWNGTNPSLKSVLLNSHMDVVNADPSKWTYPPYEAYKDAQGNIYARGASDMKSATVAQLEAIRRLKVSGFQPLRTIHLTIMPDEEMAGKKGMIPFVKTEQFKNLNVGIDIDEGFPIDSNNTVQITYAEKSLWHFNITAHGEASHGSNLPEFTAAQRLQVVIDKLMAYRQSEYNKLQLPNTTIEDVTSLNLAKLGGGIGDNIIPNEVWASFDMRILLKPGWNFTDVENMLMNVLDEARLGSTPNEVSLQYIVKSLEAGRTPVNESNVWWTELQNTCRQMNINCEPHILTAATDGRYVRDVGIPVFGICPFPNTPGTAHQDDEFINEFEFLKGIDRYATIIRNFAMVPETVHA